VGKAVAKGAKGGPIKMVFIPGVRARREFRLSMGCSDKEFARHFSRE